MRIDEASTLGSDGPTDVASTADDRAEGNKDAG
jgi:hypothetical protein